MTIFIMLPLKQNLSVKIMGKLRLFYVPRVRR
ncbi:hypothetical protein CY0110_19137 [Crocosphaera chwakensis CCY0110]|uniref:Uncharacterized protein n=1 Tax=Crocosphaera chwakensis CCY0110 TaxID=391612 RepID=A3IJF9_9CHRO|nr:hypothetical protein CY0110_19137 [Crocosphaera chwakensis CCY0110]